MKESRSIRHAVVVITSSAPNGCWKRNRGESGKETRGLTLLIPPSLCCNRPQAGDDEPSDFSGVSGKIIRRTVFAPLFCIIYVLTTASAFPLIIRWIHSCAGWSLTPEFSKILEGNWPIPKRSACANWMGDSLLLEDLFDRDIIRVRQPTAAL
ncbi:conserved hypothetical protein [Coccidioides posadasii str. Silveira]|uniref:Uncharacterized protein n=1 Tax=Coccidioides posadasii (strain RMSCC 757 / Silveira) TaxID=443226 RepID=E9CT34_COCPS|nr:conserved hypothetical protein [Coccidioides posadasii str. Silveira]